MTDNNLADHMHRKMTGEEFCELFQNLSKKLVKLTNESECHNGFQFVTGLNVDIIPFNPTGTCQAGGIYFTDMDNLSRWLEYGVCVMKYYRTVTLPPNCRVYIEENKFKADKIILGERVEIKNLDCWSNEEYCLNALEFIQHKSWQYIKNENVQLEAINRGISIAHMLANQTTISEKVLRYSMTKNSFFPSVNWNAEYSEAIMYASKYGYLDVVKFLLSDEITEKYPKIDPSAGDNYAIRWASYSGHIDVVKFLLSDEITKKYPKIDPSAFNNNNAIRRASACGYLEVIKFLLSDEISAKYPNIDPSAEDNYAVRYASENGHLEVVKFLLSDEIIEKYPNIDPSADYNYAIRFASRSGQLEVVKYLLSDEIREKYPLIDPSANNNEAIRMASKYGHIDVVKYLLSDEISDKYPLIDPSANNNEAIRWANLNGHMEIVKLLSQDQRVPQTQQI